ncbi:hypothetical protein T484DRAFT_1912834, partial [Baffinella frigidus]
MGLNAAAPAFSPGFSPGFSQGGFTAWAPADALNRGDGTRENWGVGPLNARQLTAAIKDCRAPGELARILQEQRGGLNHIHVSAAWGCLVRVGRGRGGGEV